MQKRRKDQFSDKFRLLNSQENTEDINWTCSDSSDYENQATSDKNKSSHLINPKKRKRKHKVLKNVSNLNVTIVDVTSDKKDNSFGDKSILIKRKSYCKSSPTSPIFVPNMFFPPCNVKMELSSPILTSKLCEPRLECKIDLKSPILTLKHSSPKSSPKVRKKLFEEKNNNDRFESVLVSRNNVLNTRETHSPTFEWENNGRTSKNTCNNIFITDRNTQEFQDDAKQQVLEDSFNQIKHKNLDLAKKIRSYFDNQFSSDSNTQHSISESLTSKQSSKSSDEIDIVASMTQIKACKVENETQLDKDINRYISPESSESAEVNAEKLKKCRYKKNGLAYRLNDLLKKQNANISLWHHERFLVEYSNFKIPKGEHVVFRIRRVDFQYGSYLLTAVDFHDKMYLIFINSSYATEVNISTEMIIKIYEPYKIIDLTDSCKIIINVYKFECVKYLK